MEKRIDVMEHILKLSRMTRRRPMGEPHLSRGGHRLLGIALENAGIRTTDLAEKTDIRPASLTDVLKRLDEDGYIRREKDEHDSRILRVYATEKARDEYAKVEADRQSQNQRMLACLTDDEAAVFCRISDKLCAFLEKEYPQEAERGHRHHKHHAKGSHENSCRDCSRGPEGCAECPKGQKKQHKNQHHAEPT